MRVGEAAPAAVCPGARELGHDAYARAHRAGDGSGPAALWAFEQALGSGACDSVLTWARHAPVRQLRRLQLAAQRGNALGILFRPRESARESSPAMLRVVLEPRRGGARVTLLKSRGGALGALDLTWEAIRREPLEAS